jgi:hypothetical protein
MVEVVARMDADEAAAVLARIAVDADDEYVRDQASVALEARPHHSYVPALLARLGTPIELIADVSIEPGGPILESYSAYAYTGRVTPAFYHVHRRDGNYTPSDVAAWGLEAEAFSGLALTGYRPDRIQYNYVLTRESDDPDSPHELAGAIEGSSDPWSRSRQVASIEDLHEQVRQANENTAALNKRIQQVLAKATHVEIKPRGLQQADEHSQVDPRPWWDWWKSQTRTSHYIAQGIEVWTKTGLLPIEQILVGDRVLTRDAKSGALDFNLVIGIDAQGETPMQVIEVGSRQIVASPEQPFFVSNVGWRKARELQTGMRLDSLIGPQQILSVATGGAVQRYSLLVANVPTYQVDRSGFLVHDATRP